MRDVTAQDQAGYPGSVERLYAWLRRHPWLVDGTLAVILLAGAANAYLGSAAVLPASLALAGTVAVRRRFPVSAYAVALAIGVAQVVVGIGPTFTNSPLQPTFADAGNPDPALHRRGRTAQAGIAAGPGGVRGAVRDRGRAVQPGRARPGTRWSTSS